MCPKEHQIVILYILCKKQNIMYKPKDGGFIKIIQPKFETYFVRSDEL